MKPVYIYPAIAALMLASCGDKDKKAAAPEQPTVEVAAAQTDTVLLKKEYPGTLSANNTVDIVGRVNGYLLTQNFDNGSAVKKGQVLFTIEDTQYRDAVTQAEAQLETAQSQYEYADKHYAAMQKALESDAVAQIQVLDAKSALEQAEAAVANAKAALQTARTNLSYCTVRAPMDGDMSLGNYSAGNYISGAGAPVTLATLYDNSALNANFYIEDASFLRMFENENGRSQIDYKQVPISFSESLPHSYSGDLNYISPDVDTKTGTLHLRALVQNPYHELRDGMYVTVTLPYKLEPNAVLVKETAISTSQAGKYLYVVNDSNKVVYTPIEVGDMANDSMRVVTKGITGGERYVTKALLKVRPDMVVKPVLTK